MTCLARSRIYASHRSSGGALDGVAGIGPSAGRVHRVPGSTPWQQFGNSHIVRCVRCVPKPGRYGRYGRSGHSRTHRHDQRTVQVRVWATKVKVRVLSSALGRNWPLLQEARPAEQPGRVCELCWRQLPETQRPAPGTRRSFDRCGSRTSSARCCDRGASTGGACAYIGRWDRAFRVRRRRLSGESLRTWPREFDQAC